jgi:hypothetical protein
MKIPLVCLFCAASTVALAQDIPAPLNVTTATAGRQEIFTLENLNAGVVTGGGDEADLLFEAKTDAGNVYRIGGLGGVVTNRGNATRTGDLVVRCGPGEGMSERLRIANDGSVVVNGSGAGALRVGTAPTDNRTNTQVQVLGSIAAYPSSDLSESDIFAADLNFYNNGSSPTWAGAGMRWYGKTAPGTWGSTSIPLAQMAIFIGQNAANTALAANGLGTIYVLNANGVGIRVNSNLTTSFFGNQATTVAAGEVQIGGGQINTSGNIYVQATGTNNASLSLKGASGGSNYYLTSSQGGDQFAIYDGTANLNRMTLSGGKFTFLGAAPTTVVNGQVAIGGGG